MRVAAADGVSRILPSPAITRRYQLELQIKNLPGSTSSEHWPEARFVIDAKRKGNVGRFINHSRRRCNIFPQMAFTEGHCDALMPTVAFFASERIDAFTELLFGASVVYFTSTPHRNDRGIHDRYRGGGDALQCAVSVPPRVRAAGMAAFVRLAPSLRGQSHLLLLGFLPCLVGVLTCACVLLCRLRAGLRQQRPAAALAHRR